MASTDVLPDRPPPDPGEIPRLLVPRPLTARLARHAVEGYPHEVCGLLLGRATRATTELVGVTRARNRADPGRLRDRYVLEPEDFLHADREARANGLDVVGVWHTHPDHPARPSETDRAAAWPEFSYLILSVARGVVADVTSWRLIDDRFAPQPIEETLP